MYSSLPFTGFSTLIYAGIGLGAVIGGAAIRLFGRKR
jgi:predicted MFS family arabinose efflux permease